MDEHEQVVNVLTVINGYKHLIRRELRRLRPDGRRLQNWGRELATALVGLDGLDMERCPECANIVGQWREGQFVMHYRGRMLTCRGVDLIQCEDCYHLWAPKRD